MAFAAQGGAFPFLLEVLTGLCPFFFSFLKKRKGLFRGGAGAGWRWAKGGNGGHL